MALINSTGYYKPDQKILMSGNPASLVNPTPESAANPTDSPAQEVNIPTQGYEPERVELGDQDTVEGRVNRLISENSGLIKNARQRATLASDQQMNRRGLISSSIGLGAAVSAAENAAYDRVLPIASQDAQTAFQAKGLNQAAGNQAQAFTAGATNTAALQTAAGQQALQQIKAAGATDVQLQNLRGDQAESLADLENQWGTLRQTSQSAAMVLQQTNANIGAILANPDIDAGAKQALVDKAVQQTQLSLNLIGKIANLDFSDLFSDVIPNPGSQPAPGAQPYPYYDPRTNPIPYGY